MKMKEKERRKKIQYEIKTESRCLWTKRRQMIKEEKEKNTTKNEKKKEKIKKINTD